MTPTNTPHTRDAVRASGATGIDDESPRNESGRAWAWAVCAASVMRNAVGTATAKRLVERCTVVAVLTGRQSHPDRLTTRPRRPERLASGQRQRLRMLPRSARRPEHSEGERDGSDDDRDWRARPAFTETPGCPMP